MEVELIFLLFLSFNIGIIIIIKGLKPLLSRISLIFKAVSYVSWLTTMPSYSDSLIGGP